MSVVASPSWDIEQAVLDPTRLPGNKDAPMIERQTDTHSRVRTTGSPVRPDVEDAGFLLWGQEGFFNLWNPFGGPGDQSPSGDPFDDQEGADRADGVSLRLEDALPILLGITAGWFILKGLT